MAYTSAVSTTSGARQQAAAAIANVLPNVDATLLDTVQIGANPAGTRSGPWLYFNVNCPSVLNGACIPSLWEADLVQGDVAELMASSQTNLANVITGSTVTATLEGGSKVTFGGDQGDVAVGQQFTADQTTDSSIDRSIADICGNLGLSVVNIRVLHPLDDALYLRVGLPSNSDGTGVTISEIESAIQARVGMFEGMYVDVALADGAIVARASVAYRSGAGRQWADPGFPGLTGIPHG